MDVAAFVLAVISLVLSTLALGWHVISWLLTGSWVRVKWSHSTVVGAQPDPGVLLAITATNVGRAPIEVTGWGLELPDGSHMPGHASPLPWVPSVPHTLEGGHQQQWHMPVAGLVEALRKAGYTHFPALRPFVTVAGGKRKRARKPYQPEPPGDPSHTR